MARVHVINAIEVPLGLEQAAELVRDEYVKYFRRQHGFVSSTFYKATDVGSAYHYINIVVWESKEAFDAVVNLGFTNVDGTNADGRQVLGKGFPEPILVHPGRYQIISEDSALSADGDDGDNGDNGDDG